MNTHEEEACNYFIRNNQITEVLQAIKPGKEATVFICRGSEAHQNKLLCLKIYKDAVSRSFKNNDVYSEGRYDSLSRREKLAIKKKSKFGKEIMESAWLSTSLDTYEPKEDAIRSNKALKMQDVFKTSSKFSEIDVLTRLHQAGLNVPRPISSSNTAILMEYIGDQDQIANQLKDEELNEQKTSYLFQKIINNIQQMFNLNIVHGDLSAYNILVWKNQPVIIDFPQTINPDNHSKAFDILYRDVDNICNFFAKKGIEADSWRITNNIWQNEKIYFGNNLKSTNGVNYVR